MGVSSRSLPIQTVPSADRNTRPVGMEMASVVTRNAPRKAASPVVTNMWCAHTRPLRATMPRKPPTAQR